MIACDSDTCKFEWFHFPCVGLTKKPEPNYNGQWLCEDCLATAQKKS